MKRSILTLLLLISILISACGSSDSAQSAQNAASTYIENKGSDTIAGARVQGKILLEGKDIYAEDVDVVDLRQRVGMVFQKPNPFPQPIYDNVAFGPRVLRTTTGKADLDETVETSLKAAALWEDVKD